MLANIYRQYSAEFPVVTGDKQPASKGIDKEPAFKGIDIDKTPGMKYFNPMVDKAQTWFTPQIAGYRVVQDMDPEAPFDVNQLSQFKVNNYVNRYLRRTAAEQEEILKQEKAERARAKAKAKAAPKEKQGKAAGKQRETAGSEDEASNASSASLPLAAASTSQHLPGTSTSVTGKAVKKTKVAVTLPADLGRADDVEPEVEPEVGVDDKEGDGDVNRLRKRKHRSSSDHEDTQQATGSREATRTPSPTRNSPAQSSPEAKPPAPKKPRQGSSSSVASSGNSDELMHSAAALLKDNAATFTRATLLAPLDDNDIIDIFGERMRVDMDVEEDEQPRPFTQADPAEDTSQGESRSL